MESVLLMGVVCIGMLVAFVIGAQVGQKAVRGEKIEMPTVTIPNPVQALREREEKREAKAEADRMDIIMRNIEKYDGTSSGQEDVPRR